MTRGAPRASGCVHGGGIQTSDVGPNDRAGPLDTTARAGGRRRGWQIRRLRRQRSWPTIRWRCCRREPVAEPRRGLLCAQSHERSWERGGRSSRRSRRARLGSHTGSFRLAPGAQGEAAVGGQHGLRAVEREARRGIEAAAPSAPRAKRRVRDPDGAAAGRGACPVGGAPRKSGEPDPTIASVVPEDEPEDRRAPRRARPEDP